MTKTKRQLRSEAVERLRKIRGARYPICDSDIGAAIANGNIDNAIDLLTDDEPNDSGATPEFDVPLYGWHEGDTREKLIEKIIRNLAAEVTNGGVEIHGAIPIEDALKSAMQRVDDLLTDDEAVNCKKLESLQDSREKLEAEAHREAGYFYGRGFTNGTANAWNDDEADSIANMMIALLDRQAAITKREVLCHPDERDEQIAELEEKNRLIRERLRSIADNDVTVFGMKLDEVHNLQAKVVELEAENDELRAKLHEIAKAVER